MKKEWLHIEWLNNSVSSYLTVLLILVFLFLVKRIVSKFLATQLYRLVKDKSKHLYKAYFFELVIQPLELFLILLITVVSIEKLNYPKALNFTIYKIHFRTILDATVNGAIVISFIWLCLRIIDFTAIVLQDKANQTKDQNDNQLVVFFKDFFKVIVVVVGVLLVLKFSFNRHIGSLLTGLSIVGAAMALATRESLENLIASFIIFFDKPFTTGDQVKVHNFTGTVEKIGLRSTRIRTIEKTYITVPNKQMVDSILDNLSLRTQRKVEIRLEIGLSHDAKSIHQFIQSLQQIMHDERIEQYQVYFGETGKQAHLIFIDYFANASMPIELFNELKQEINLKIIDLMQQQKIQFAASSTDVVVHQA